MNWCSACARHRLRHPPAGRGPPLSLPACGRESDTREAGYSRGDVLCSAIIDAALARRASGISARLSFRGAPWMNTRLDRAGAHAGSKWSRTRSLDRQSRL